MAENKRPQGWASWPTIRAVSETLGLNQSEARRELTRAGIKPFNGDDGTKRFNPKEIDELAEALALEDAEEQEATAKGETARKRGAEADAVKQLTEFVKVQSAHVQQLHKTLVELVSAMPAMMKEAQSILTNAATRDADAIARFYAEREEMFRLREEALSEKADREMLREQMLADERRKDIAFTALKDSAPRLLNQIVATIGARSGDPKVTAAVQLLQSVDDASLCMLLDESVGILNAEQREQLKKVLGAEKCQQLEELRKKEGAA